MNRDMIVKPTPASYTEALKANRHWLQLGLLKTMKLPLRLRSMIFAGRRRYCVVCDRYTSMFIPHGIALRFNARCPLCGSLERHRLTWLLYLRLFGQNPLIKLLHFAPEPCLRARFLRILGRNYLSADLTPRRAMIVQDLTALTLPDRAFHAICCNHVLEHIPEDHLALRELYRVLAPGGIALVQVPLRDGPTIEDASVTDPFEREKRFGQHDHVRVYGRDLVDRCEAAGFEVDRLNWADLCRQRCAVGFGIESTDCVFVLRRPASG